MNTSDIDIKIKYLELQLKLATDDDAITKYSNELANLRFKKHLNLLIQKANNIKCKRIAQEQPLPHIPFRY